jgi:hypothetical protein
MNNFAYSSQKPEVVGPKVAEIIGKELGIAPPQFEIEMTNVPQTSAKTLAYDIGRALFGGKTDSLFTIVFKINAARPLEIRANAIRQGVGCIIGTLIYTTPLSKNVDAETRLGEPKAFGAPKFEGSQAAAKLNAAGDLCKRANKLARNESNASGLTLRIQRMFSIFPQSEEPPTLAVCTLARSISMGFSVALDLNEFLDLAGFIEKIL